MIGITNSIPLVADPKQLLLELASLHQLSELLPLAVKRLAEGLNVALVRIWLTLPTPSDDCSKCRFASECPNKERCLHLVASAGRSLDITSSSWDRLDGSFRRLPIGLRKVGQIAAAGQSMVVPNVSGDQSWAADPQWLLKENISSFAGHPLVYRGVVLGVLGLFARKQPGDTCFDWLRMIADHLAAAIANARLLDEVNSLKQLLELENAYLREEVKESTSVVILLVRAPHFKSLRSKLSWLLRLIPPS